MRGARPARPSDRSPLVGAVVLTAVAVVAATTAVIVLAVRHRAAPGPPSPPATSAPTLPGSTTTSTAPPVADGTYPVGTTTVTAVDSSVAGQGPRQVPTTVLYPAVSSSPGAPAARTGAPFPLLVFSEGYGHAPLAYQVLLDAWASAGFVVAAPAYPGADPTEAALDRADLVDQPTDLKAVVARMAAAGDTGGSVLDGAVDVGALGLVGQSDGGDVSLAVAADSADRDAGVRAVAVLAGAEYAGFGGQYFSAPSPPLLVVQGTADATNPPSCSAQLYDAAPAPKYYLSLPGATHLAPYQTAGAAESAVAQVTTDFFELTLDARSSAAPAMAAAGNVAGVATLATGGTQPVGPPPCPTAP